MLHIIIKLCVLNFKYVLQKKCFHFSSGHSIFPKMVSYTNPDSVWINDPTVCVYVEVYFEIVDETDFGLWVISEGLSVCDNDSIQ